MIRLWALERALGRRGQSGMPVTALLNRRKLAHSPLKSVRSGLATPPVPPETTVATEEGVSAAESSAALDATPTGADGCAEDSAALLVLFHIERMVQPAFSNTSIHAICRIF
jgi:hypothetical protein